MLLEYRPHTWPCNGRYRVWTEEDAGYGAFQLVSTAELKIIIRACTLMGWAVRPAPDVHPDDIVTISEKEAILVCPK